MSDSSVCPSPNEVLCAAENCRPRCGMEVIDELLGGRGDVTGEEADLLLDLRSHLRNERDAEGAMRLFCDLRIRMEQRHYLAFFRLRRWLENHLMAEIHICPVAAPHLVTVKFDHFCVEAIRRMSLCTAMREGLVLLAPRLRFAFRAPTPIVLEGMIVEMTS